MSDYRRRRFLTDLLFVGGAVLAAAGLASVSQSQAELTPSPVDCKLPVAAETPALAVSPSPAPDVHLAHPGATVALPPQPRRVERDPFNRPVENVPVEKISRPMPGGMPPPPRK
jgi:hypothetical protein